MNTNSHQIQTYLLTNQFPDGNTLPRNTEVDRRPVNIESFEAIDGRGIVKVTLHDGDTYEVGDEVLVENGRGIQTISIRTFTFEDDPHAVINPDLVIYASGIVTRGLALGEAKFFPASEIKGLARERGKSNAEAINELYS